MAIIKNGEKFNVRGHLYEVVEYVNSSEIWVKVLGVSEDIFKVRAKSLRSGTARNPFDKKHYGVGYFGAGKYSLNQNDSVKKAYRIWYNMLTRCYSEISLKNHPTYKGCSVHPNWHNFQVFAGWYLNQIGMDKGYHLDKDILLSENKVYSEIACCLVPHELNILFVNYKNSELPTGVFNHRNGRYKSGVRMDGEYVNLGVYETVEDAEQAYKSAKNTYVRLKAEEFKESLPEKVYNAIIESTK